jgi:hypothetical protein
LKVYNEAGSRTLTLSSFSPTFSGSERIESERGTAAPALWSSRAAAPAEVAAVQWHPRDARRRLCDGTTPRSGRRRGVPARGLSTCGGTGFGLRHRSSREYSHVMASLFIHGCARLLGSPASSRWTDINQRRDTTPSTRRLHLSGAARLCSVVARSGRPDSCAWWMSSRQGTVMQIRSTPGRIRSKIDQTRSGMVGSGKPACRHQLHAKISACNHL